jgi:hypothetical protein
VQRWAQRSAADIASDWLRGEIKLREDEFARRGQIEDQRFGASPTIEAAAT